jgi:hypothetical protein
MPRDPKIPFTSADSISPPPRSLRRSLRFALGEPDSTEAVRLIVEQGVPVAELRPGWLHIEPWFPDLLNQLMGVESLEDGE